MRKLEEKLTLKSGVELKNRLMLAPMTTTQSFYDGALTSDEIAYYAARAGGVGAVITGTAYVQDNGKGWDGELSIADDAMIPGLRKLATAIQEKGAKAIIQIFHIGRMTSSKVLNGEQTVSASSVAAERPDAEVPRALSEDEIYQIIKNFGEATRRAIESGFDGVEVHGANTYLIQQFFSPHSNRREDKWGGTLEKRYTFIKEVLDEVFATVKKHAQSPFIVGYRFSPEEFEKPGISLDDTMYLLKQLVKTDLDYVHVSLNDYKRKSISQDYQDKTILQYVHAIVENNIPLVGVGGVRTQEQAEELLQDAEFAAVGKQLIVEPDWAEKVLANKASTASAPFEELFRQVPITHPLYTFLIHVILGLRS